MIFSCTTVLVIAQRRCERKTSKKCLKVLGTELLHFSCYLKLHCKWKPWFYHRGLVDFEFHYCHRCGTLNNMCTQWGGNYARHIIRLVWMRGKENPRLFCRPFWNTSWINFARLCITRPALAGEGPNARPRRGAPLSNSAMMSSCSVNRATTFVIKMF